MTRWAFLEWRLRELVYDLLEISPKEGRVAVGGTRATDYLAKSLDLIHLKRLKITTDLKGLKKPLQKIQEFRGGIAHGVWVYHSETETPVLQWLKGEYQDPNIPETKKARFDPLSKPVNWSDLRLAVNAVGQHISMVERTRAEIAALLAPSPEKS